MPQALGKRIYPRQLRRLQVRFWRPQEERPRQGFTKNVSLTGAFVSTPDPAMRGERLRLELSGAGRAVLLYAIVVHSHRVPPELRRFADSAMGLRFLGLDEVVGPFLGDDALRPLPDAAAGPAAVVEDVGTAASSGPWTAFPEGEGPGRPPAAAPGGDSQPAAQVATTPGTPVRSAPVVPPGPSPVDSSAPHYVLAFESEEEFLAMWRRDLSNGGLFLTTDRPARLDQRVSVELRLPGAGAAVLRLEGRVVQVVEPRPLASGRTVGGMGLELLDPEAVSRQLAPHVREG